MLLTLDRFFLTESRKDRLSGILTAHCVEEHNTNRDFFGTKKTPTMTVGANLNRKNNENTHRQGTKIPNKPKFSDHPESQDRSDRSDRLHIPSAHQGCVCGPLIYDNRILFTTRESYRTVCTYRLHIPSARTVCTSRSVCGPLIYDKRILKGRKII